MSLAGTEGPWGRRPGDKARHEGWGWIGRMLRARLGYLVLTHSLLITEDVHRRPAL